jgi:hypothetical protein
MIVSVCANTEGVYTNASDLRRTNFDGPAKDSLTIVSFDVANRIVRLNKLGVDVNWNGQKRDFSVLNLNN